MSEAKINLDVESPFTVGELFFSRTDPAGIIKAGNAVFQRVSEYAWDELLERPHKVIRHPDTPRAVFEKLWTEIKAGRPVGAYVKNRAKHGAYYWVFAVVSPVEDGYLSVRVKPTSALLPTVQAAYRAAVERERAGRPTPGESLQMLEAGLVELGFPTYSRFMATALQQELMARDAAIGRRPDRVIELFATLLKAATALRETATRISTAYRQYRYMPMNFRVQAAHLGVAGATVEAVSANYTELSSELSEAVRRFRDSAEGVESAIDNALFLVCTARLQAEMCRQFEVEPPTATSDSEVRRLKRQRSHDLELALSGVQSIARQVGVFQEDCAEMGRMATALEVTRILGKVEAAKLDTHGLDGLIEELGDFQRVLAEGVGGLRQQNATIHGATGEILAISSRARREAGLSLAD